MDKRLLILLVFTAAAGLACEREGDLFSLLAYDSDRDEYTLQTVSIRTLDDTARMKGAVTYLLAHASLELDNGENTLQWDSPGVPVSFRAIDQDGVLVPEDYDSLAMATIYYNLEISRDFFVEAGMPADLLGRVPTFYEAHMLIIENDRDRFWLEDNAIFMRYGPPAAHVRAFFIFPFDVFQWVPMAMNSGVITHEFTHAVFDVLVAAGGAARFGRLWSETAAINYFDGLNEGLADFMAVARTGDPDFISHSVPQGIFLQYCNGEEPGEVARRADVELYYTQEMDDHAEPSNPAFCPYEIGEYVSSVFYSYARELDGVGGSAIPSGEALLGVARTLYRTMMDFGEELEGDTGLSEYDAFHLAQFFDLFASRCTREISSGADRSDREIFCDILADRFEPHYLDVTNCFN